MKWTNRRLSQFQKKKRRDSLPSYSRYVPRRSRGKKEEKRKKERKEKRKKKRKERKKEKERKKRKERKNRRSSLSPKKPYFLGGGEKAGKARPREEDDAQRKRAKVNKFYAEILHFVRTVANVGYITFGFVRQCDDIV